MWNIICLCICVQNFKHITWKKQPSFAILNVKKGHFLHYEARRILSYFQILSDLGCSKSVLRPFLRSWRHNMKTCITPPKTRHFTFDLLDIVALDDFDLKQGHQRLMGVLRRLYPRHDSCCLLLMSKGTKIQPE